MRIVPVLFERKLCCPHYAFLFKNNAFATAALASIPSLLSSEAPIKHVEDAEYDISVQSQLMIITNYLCA